MKLYESIKKKLNEADENLQNVYYFMVGICLDENRPDADEDEFYDMPDFGIPYKLYDENWGVEKTFTAAYSYVSKYINDGVPGTFGAIVEMKEPYAGFRDEIYNGITDSAESSDLYHFKRNGGELLFCEYTTKDGSVTVVNKTPELGYYVPNRKVIDKINSLFLFVNDKYNRELFNSDGIDEELVDLVKNIGLKITESGEYKNENELIDDLKFVSKFVNDNKEYFHDSIHLEIIDMVNDILRAMLNEGHKIKESTNNFMPKQKDKYVASYEKKFKKPVKKIEWLGCAGNDECGEDYMKVNGKKYTFDIATGDLKETETLKEGTFGEEVGFDEYADIDEMQEEFARKLLTYLQVDPEYASYVKFNKFELHRGTSWTDNNAWLRVDLELPDNSVYEYVTARKNEYPTAAELASTDDLQVYSTGIEIGAPGKGFYDIRTYTTFEPHYSWYYDENGENKDRAVTKAVEDKLVAEEDTFDDSVDAIVKEHYNDFLDIMLANEYVEEDYWEELDSKQVPDSDGFMTDYTLYTNNAGRYVCIFGDKDVYTPEDGDYDWEGETEEEAREWFNDYEGFNESEKLKEYEDIYAKVQGVELGKNEYAEFVEKIKEGKNYLCKPYKIYKLDYDEGTDKVNTTLVYEKPKTEHGVPIVSRGHYILANEEYARSLSDNQLKESSYNREDGKTDEQAYEEYVANEQKLADEYKNKLIAEINDERIKKFNELKSMLNEKKHGSDLIGGFWIPTDFRYALEGTDGHHLNAYMDLTVEDIFNMIEGNSSIEEALNELFEDYKADSAYSWGDNFLYALDKANPNAYEETLDRYEEEYEDEELNESEDYEKGNKYDRIVFAKLNDNGKDEGWTYLLTHKGCDPELEVDLYSGTFNNHSTKGRKLEKTVNSLEEVKQFLEEKKSDLGTKDFGFNINADGNFDINGVDFFDKDLVHCVKDKQHIRESEENSTLADLVSNLQNDAEQYDEAMLDDEDDVFGGTEDSYANEMLDQNVSDTIFYNDLFKGVDYGVLTDIISEVIDSIIAGGAMSESYVKHLLKKYNINPKNPIKKEAETFTIPKEIVDKVRAEYDEARPEIIKEIKKEFASFLRYAKKYYSEEELKATSTYKAYQDAIKDPEDIWCECGAPNGESYKEDGDSYLGVEKHGYICNDCGKFVQIG